MDRGKNSIRLLIVYKYKKYNMLIKYIDSVQKLAYTEVERIQK